MLIVIHWLAGFPDGVKNYRLGNGLFVLIAIDSGIPEIGGWWRWPWHSWSLASGYACVCEIFGKLNYLSRGLVPRTILVCELLAIGQLNPFGVYG